MYPVFALPLQSVQFFSHLFWSGTVSVHSPIHKRNKSMLKSRGLVRIFAFLVDSCALCAWGVFLYAALHFSGSAIMLALIVAIAISAGSLALHLTRNVSGYTGDMDLDTRLLILDSHFAES